MSDGAPHRPYYEAAWKALQAAHDACFNHPERDVLGMSSGPFSGVNEALGIIANLERKLATEQRAHVATHEYCTRLEAEKETSERIAAHKLLVASAEVANSENIKLRAEVERLRAALKRARVWLPIESPGPLARSDLAAIDEALGEQAKVEP